MVSWHGFNTLFPWDTRCFIFPSVVVASSVAIGVHYLCLDQVPLVLVHPLFYD